MNQAQIAIVIPCFNEGDRLQINDFSKFLSENPEVNICFVNDASTDNTLELLDAIKQKFPNQITVITNKNNLGKAASVREGILHYQNNGIAPFLAYLDADLATSLEECYSYTTYLSEGKDFVFASRILKIGSVIERKTSRFLFGRIIATFISHLLGIKVYDTQCGCKVFKSDLALVLFENPFISKWLFDVELLSRMLCYFGKETALDKMEEIPVKCWIDRGESKVKLSYFFRLWIDLYLIWKIHNNTIKKSPH